MQNDTQGKEIVRMLGGRKRLKTVLCLWTQWRSPFLPVILTHSLSLRSSGTPRVLGSKVLTDVSRQPLGHVFKDQELTLRLSMGHAVPKRR